MEPTIQQRRWDIPATKLTILREGYFSHNIILKTVVPESIGAIYCVYHDDQISAYEGGRRGGSMDKDKLRMVRHDKYICKQINRIKSL